MDNRTFERPRIQFHSGGTGKQEQAQSHETHVADRRVRHQFFHIGLYQSHHTDINHRNQAQYDNCRRKIARSIRQNRQDKAQETVSTHFQGNRRQHHRTTGRRFHVGIGQPSVHRPHRHFHRKRKEECNKQQLLHAQRNLFQILEVHNREAAAGLVRQIHQTHQHQQRAEQGIEKQFHRSIYTARATPHTDDQVQRNQHAFEEYVKQNRILRGKRTVNQAGHNQESGHVLRGAFLNHFPTGQHHHQRDKRIQDDKQHGNTVHTQRIVDVQHGNPTMKLGKLVTAAQAVKSGKQRQRYQETGQRTD